MRILATTLLLALAAAPAAAADGPPDCGSCHDQAAPDAVARLGGSAHAALACGDCHPGTDRVPHVTDAGHDPGSTPCRGCHAAAAGQYTRHGHLPAPGDEVPTCAGCHGSHGIEAVGDAGSSVAPANLANTCGACHADVDLVRRHDLQRDAIGFYRESIHGSGSPPAASCVDCHARSDNPHAITWAGDPDSPICFYRIPDTCGRCHGEIADAYGAGAHGQQIRRGDTDAPVCTDCHGEHAIVATDSPASPVSATRVAPETCAPCHQSVLLAEEYGLQPGVTTSFFDTYHGKKSMTGDVDVADCADCHGAHEVRGPQDPASRVHPDNVQATCARCHEGISAALAGIPIHGVGGGGGFRTRPARVVEGVYVVAIVVIIGLMAVHWLLDLARRLVDVARERPRLRRMRTGEVLQHALLTVSFTALVLTGFALAYDQAFWVDWLFGWEGGFELRRLLHRIAAAGFLLVIVWHVAFLAFTGRGRGFFRDMLPRRDDFRFFFRKLAHAVGRRDEEPRGARFTYVEKAEYWALVWGAVVMVASGLMLWFDNTVAEKASVTALDVAWVVHFWEAWLATLAILVWHLYSTVFNPEVYPMNPSWLTGHMPERQYAAEHPRDLERAREETAAEDGGRGPR